MESLLQRMARGKALLLVIILGFGGNFQSGYHLTSLSSPTPFIQSFINSSWYERWKEVPSPETVTLLWSFIVASFAIGGFCGCLCVKFITAIMGRKKGVICSGCIAVVAAVIMLSSKPAKSFEMIIVARILAGFSAGFGWSLHIMYLSEISPKSIRGRVTITSANFTSLGGFVGQLLGLSEILGREDLWNVALSVNACFSVLLVLVFPFLPESPRYLFIEKGDKEACRKALQTLWGPGSYKQEMDEMLIEQERIDAVGRKNPLQLLKDRTVWLQLVTIVLIYWFNQTSGMSVITTFSFDIFMQSGVPENMIRYVTLGLGVCQFITSMFSSFLIERIGRRPLVWGGYAAMCTSWVVVTILLNVKGLSDWVSYISAAMIILILVFFAGGPGAAVGTLCGEIFIQSDRMAASAIVGMLRWLAIAVMTFSFPFLINSLGSYTFVLLACFCLLAFLYTFFILPETKGKTIVEITEEFKAIMVCRKSSSEETSDTMMSRV
ncbi:solute carrier family 2, facilitated glucose transporter member 9-like [Salarias fasciatus]|uniref:solute carrier family 2, facilitated glucose transporter member 9-like n=1 Tax=Salarias fasciatus TaxID=181472 RepID=UPI001176CE1B|nr:solute carrier family 2, facilitated glucose transporter member 9-like [Salarias fasciatus]